MSKLNWIGNYEFMTYRNLDASDYKFEQLMRDGWVIVGKFISGPGAIDFILARPRV